MTSSSSSSEALFKGQRAFVKRQGEAFLGPNEKRQKVIKTTIRKSNPLKSTTSSSSSRSCQRPKDLVLATIVEQLQGRFLNGQTKPLTFEEIIAEFNLTNDSSSHHWLSTVALLDNLRVDVKKIDDINRFVYKPPLDLKGPKKEALLNLIKSRDERCEGVVTVDDVRESIQTSKVDKIINSLIQTGKISKRISNKKEILDYIDREHNLGVHSDFVDLWRKTSVAGLDDDKILEYIRNHGHKGLAKNAPRPIFKRAPGRRNPRPITIKCNQHVAHQLEDFSNTINKK